MDARQPLLAGADHAEQAAAALPPAGAGAGAAPTVDGSGSVAVLLEDRQVANRNCGLSRSGGISQWVLHFAVQRDRRPPVICRWACGSPVGGAAPALPPAAPGSPLRRRSSVAEGLGSGVEQLVGDEYKERHRQDVRTVFNFLRWRQHRSSAR